MVPHWGRIPGALAGLAAVVCCAGCAGVDARPDFRRARDLIAGRTGAAGVYDPSEAALVEERVTRALADGLTIDEAVSVALLNNPSFQAAFNEIGVSRAELVQSGLLTNPTASLALQFPEGGGRAKLNAGLAQELVDLWQIPIRKKIAQARLEEAILRTAAQGVALASQVKSAYYRVLGLRQGQAILHENVSLAEQSVALADARLRAGEISRVEVTLALEGLLEARMAALSIRREVDQAEADLARLLGRPELPSPVPLVDPLPEPRKLPHDPAELVRWAARQRFDAQAALARLAAAEHELRRQYLNVVPSVTAGAELERNERRALPGRKVLADTARESIAQGRPAAPAIQSRGQRALERRLEIDAVIGPTLQATVPLWDQNQAQIAKADYGRNRQVVEALMADIVQDVRRAATAYASAAEVVEFYRTEALPLAAENLEASQRLFQEGQEGVLVLMAAQQAFLQQRRAWAQACQDFAVAAAELERAVGGRLPSAESSRPAGVTTRPAGP